MPSLSTTSCTTLRSERVQWLWKPYLARGKLAVLDGDPGAGKSFFAIDLAAKLSRLGRLPDGQVINEPHTTLLLSAEDDAGDTVLPRLKAANADLERIHIVSAPGLGTDALPQFPADLPELEAAIRNLKADLVVIDPMMPFFPQNMWANSDQCIRRALTPFAAMAAGTGAAILFIRHITKAGGTKAIYRGSGSIGIIGAARTGLLLGRHPDDPDLRVLSVLKTNIGQLGSSLGFRLVSEPDTGETRLVWTGPVALTADDLCVSSPTAVGNRPRDRAKEWLKAMLAGGSRKASELLTWAASAGISEKTLYRAKDLLRVTSEKGGKADNGDWWWHDPAVSKPVTADDALLPPLEDIIPGYKERMEKIMAKRRNQEGSGADRKG